MNTSSQLDEKHVINAHNAYDFAIQLGTRLNTFLTVVLKHMRGKNGWRAGVPAERQVATQRAHVLRALADYCRYHGFPFAYVCVLENAQGPGPHLHILMHLPEDAPPLLYRNMAPDPTWHRHRHQLLSLLNGKSGWTRAELERQEAKKASDGETITTWLPCHIMPIHLSGGGPDLSAVVMLRYMAKAISPDTVVEHDGKRLTICEFAGDFQKDVTLRPSADTHCRRMLTTSQNLAISARKAAGWTEMCGMVWLNRAIERKTLVESAEKRAKEWSDKKLHTPIKNEETLDLNKDIFARGQDVADILMKSMQISCLNAPNQVDCARIEHSGGMEC